MERISDQEFHERLRSLDGETIWAIAGGLHAVAAAFDDVERLEAMVEIDQILRIEHLERQGAGAARRARELVRWAAERDRLDPEARPVVSVGRAAADVARTSLTAERISERTARQIRAWLSVFGFHPTDRGLWLPA
jgi:hypothetical protein